MQTVHQVRGSIFNIEKHRRVTLVLAVAVVICDTYATQYHSSLTNRCATV